MHRISPALTGWPALTRTRSTVPPLGERISFCIFMASITTRPWPASTQSPAWTRRCTTLPGMGATICWRPSASTWLWRPLQARGSMPSAVNSCAPVWIFSWPSAAGVTLISKDWPSSKRERMLGAIWTASTAMGRPSKVTRQPAVSRSSSMTRFFSPQEKDVSWTSYLMAAVQLRTTAFLLPARGLVYGRSGQTRMSVPLVCLPHCGGDGRGIGSRPSRLTSVRRHAGAWAAKQLVQPLGVDLAAEKIGFIKDAAEEPGVGLDANDSVFLEGAPKASNGFLAAIPPGNELAEKRIVIVGYRPTLVDAVVQANARTAGNLARNNCSW